MITSFLIALAIIVYMSGTSRLSGMRWDILDRYKITWLPELFFAAGFGVAAFMLLSATVGISLTIPFVLEFSLVLSNYFIGVLSTVWSYLWMQTGHGAILHWGMEKIRDPNRTQHLTPTVDKIAKVFKIEKNSTNYCRLFMGVKGFLIGLPVGGIVLFFLWPLAYEIGARLRGKVPFDPHALAEFLAGAFAGIAIIIALFLGGIL